MPNFKTKVLSHYQIKAKQTADNWQGEGCQNYDDSQDVCLDGEIKKHDDAEVSKDALKEGRKIK